MDEAKELAGIDFPVSPEAGNPDSGEIIFIWNWSTTAPKIAEDIIELARPKSIRDLIAFRRQSRLRGG